MLFAKGGQSRAQHSGGEQLHHNSSCCQVKRLVSAGGSVSCQCCGGALLLERLTMLNVRGIDGVVDDLHRWRPRTTLRNARTSGGLIHKTCCAADHPARGWSWCHTCQPHHSTRCAGALYQMKPPVLPETGPARSPSLLKPQSGRLGATDHAAAQLAVRPAGASLALQLLLALLLPAPHCCAA